MITPEDIAARIYAIELAACDYEAAHSMEDRLWAEVLSAIADGADGAPELARAALKSQNIDFGRWCA